MPCFRGIEVSLAAADHSIFPEFPHPDGSSAQYSGASRGRHAGSKFVRPRLRDTLAVQAPDVPITSPRVAVYIPSAPDTNFYLRYSIAKRPRDTRYLCFRVVVNGVAAVAWGLDLDASLAGATHQALFAPSPRFQNAPDSSNTSNIGISGTRTGLESRCFRFVSAADDGGLIEVHVFRATARLRRPPAPDAYFGRAHRGVALVSNGLVDDPDAAAYYDYHLADATDAPYASFSFYYRAWETLHALQLAPAEKPAFLCASRSTEALERLHAHRDAAALARPSSRLGAPRLPRRSSRRRRPDDWLEEYLSQFQDADEADEETDEAAADLAAHDRLAMDACGETADALAARLDPSTVPRASVPDAIRDRPLPRLPTHGRRASESSIIDGIADALAAATLQAEPVHIRRSRAAAVVSRPRASPDKSGSDSLAVDTLEYGSAVRVEALFCGRPSDAKARSPVLHTPRRGQNDDVHDDVHTPDRAFDMAHVAPFTDDLCKRPLSFSPSSSPVKQRPRGVSLQEPPARRGSPVRRRHGSLDQWL